MSQNKNLFLFFSVFLLIFLSNFVFANNVFASSLQIVFSTSTDQNVPVGTPGMVKINIVDLSNDNKATETIYLNPLSTGDIQFSSNKDNWIPITSLPLDDFPTSCSASLCINSNSGSRTFYYKGSVIGQYTITVSAKSRSGIVSNNIYQVINIGITSTTTSSSENNNSNSNTSTNTLDTSNQNTQTTKIVTRTIYVSTHSGQEDLSNYDEKTAFEITAGRERMALVGSPVEFSAKYTLLQKDQCVPVFKWSFGDGFLSVGKDVTHIYKYPGEYQVVLNGICGAYNSVSRTAVKVISPDISISNLSSGDIKIINNGKTEINIGKWKIIPTFKVGTPIEALWGQKDFIFPQDTIIGADKEIILSKEDLNNNSSIERVSLNNPTGREVAFADTRKLSQVIATSSQIVMNQYVASTTIPIPKSDNVLTTKTEKSPTKSKAESALNEQQISKNENVKEIAKINSVGNNLSNNEDIVQVASVMNSLNSSSTGGFWSKLIDVPINGFKSFVRIFYDF